MSQQGQGQDQRGGPPRGRGQPRPGQQQMHQPQQGQYVFYQQPPPQFYPHQMYQQMPPPPNQMFYPPPAQPTAGGGGGGEPAAPPVSKPKAKRVGLSIMNPLTNTDVVKEIVAAEPVPVASAAADDAADKVDASRKVEATGADVAAAGKKTAGNGIAGDEVAVQDDVGKSSDDGRDVVQQSRSPAPSRNTPSRSRKPLAIVDPTTSTVVNRDDVLAVASSSSDASNGSELKPRPSGSSKVESSSSSSSSSAASTSTSTSSQPAAGHGSQRTCAYSKELMIQLRANASRPDDFNDEAFAKAGAQARSAAASTRNRGSMGFEPSFGTAAAGASGTGARRAAPARGSGGGTRAGIAQGSGGGGGGNFRQASGGGAASGSGGRGAAGGRTIQLPARQDPKLNKVENRFIPSSQKEKGSKADKSLLDEVRMALNKLTLEKFDKLAKHLVELMLSDTEQLGAVTAMIFEKAVDEPFFCVVYSKLCRALCDFATEKKTLGVSIQTGKEEPVARLFKACLLNNCQKQFEKADKDTAIERAAEAAAKAAAENPEELERISKLATAEREKYEFELREGHRDAILRVAKVRRHIIGNITFIGELFLVDMVTEPIMRHCFDHLLSAADDERPDFRDEGLEQLCKLMETAGAKLEKKYKKEKAKSADKKDAKAADYSVLWEDLFKSMDAISRRKNLPSRIKFAIQDVLDMRKGGWVQRAGKQKGPKTIEEIRAEAKSELIAEQIATEKHQRSGGGFGGRSGGQGRRLSQASNSRTTSQQADMIRSNATINPTGFSFGAPSKSGLSLGAQGRKKSLASTNAPTRIGGNTYGALRNETMSSRPSLVGMKAAAAPAEVADDIEDVAEAVEAAPNFRPEELRKKINGTLTEFFDIMILEEVKACLDEMGRVSQVYQMFCTEAIEKLESLKANERTTLYKLFKQIIGVDRGIPIESFNSALEEFFERSELADLICDAPKLPDYIGEIIGAAVVSDVKAMSAIVLLGTDTVQQALSGVSTDTPLKIALSAYAAIKGWEGESRAMHLYSTSGVTLASLIPLDAARLDTLLDIKGLKWLLRPREVGSVVENLVRDGATYEAVCAVIDELKKQPSGVDMKTVGSISEAIISGVTSKTTLATGISGKEPSEEESAKEAELLDVYKDILRSIAETAEAQFAVVSAVARFAADKNFPKDMVNRLFNYLYDREVVEEDTFLRFKSDKALDEQMPKKIVAVQQATNFFDRLAQPE